jgi:hypothetical protein
MWAFCLLRINLNIFFISLRERHGCFPAWKRFERRQRSDARRRVNVADHLSLGGLLAKHGITEPLLLK